ncbi:histone H2A.Z variant [Aphelenchoides avenae]|nr:histone H2A.Z variant [Aphelenchus avenae]
MHALRDALVADDFEFPPDTYNTHNPQINRHFGPLKRSTTMPKTGAKASQKVAKTGNTADGFEDGGKKKMIKRMTNTRRAGLEFPVGRIVRKIRDVAGKQQRVSVTAGVYAASILEYLVAEVIELAGNAAKDLKTKRISPRHLYLAMHGDEEVEKLVKTDH